MKIMERDAEPATVEEAIMVACRLEAIRRTADTDRVEEAKHREKNIRAVEVKARTTNETIGKSEQKVKELEPTVDEYRKELDRMKLVIQQLQQRVTEAEKAGQRPAGLNNAGAFGHVPGNYAQPPQRGGQYAYQDAYQQQNYYNANYDRDYNRPQGHNRVVDRGQHGDMVDSQVTMCADVVVWQVTGRATVHRCQHSQLGRRSMALRSKQMA